MLRISTLALCFAFALPAQTHWIVSWGASPAPQVSAEQMRSANLVFQNQTLREIIHTSAGGTELRLRLSNAYGAKPLEIASVHVALRSTESAIKPGTDHAVTFGGRNGVTIPADGLVLSDPVKFDAPMLSDLAVSIFVPGAATGAGVHYASQETSYVAAGDQTSAASLTSPSKITSWVFLSSVEVLNANTSATLVAFGDSITDGSHSTIDANHRWPDFLAVRLLKQHSARIGVLDAGIGGNRILHDPAGNPRFGVNALARFDRDVLAQPNVKYLIILEGINDLGHPGSNAPTSETVSSDDIIAAMRQMIDRAHEHGIKVFGATITPFDGCTIAGYFSPEKEVKRKAINEWIRNGKAFDGVVDFDKAVRDPEHADRMLAKYDSGDHLHPDDTGYEAMGNAIDLALFR
ncbi:MAG TPA: SGNH/GDSL hydrolase family protein [Bryobacteraceae bacterium]|nr:SGNH/GDSL hydrolase family protein [Bryobacteraceae bacterium]